MPNETKRKQLLLDRIRRGVVNEEGKIVPFVPKAHLRICSEQKAHLRICSEHFIGGAKVDDVSQQAYVPTIFPRNSKKLRQTKRSTLAGVYTPAPQANVRKTQLSAPSGFGRPSTPKRLDFCEDTDNAVWNGDHDYLKQGPQNVQEEGIESLKKENSELKSKQLRLENINDNPEKFQIWTNLPNYEVFKSLCTYLETRLERGSLPYWKGKSTGNGSARKRRPDRKLSFEEQLFIFLSS